MAKGADLLGQRRKTETLLCFINDAKEPSQNKVYISYGLRVYGIVPLAVKFITDDVDLSQLLVRDFDTLGILLGIKFAFDCQACVGRG